MPLTTSREPVRPRRRSVLLSAGSALLTAGAALLAGCSGGSGTRASAPPAPTAEERARARAAQDSDALAARYEAVIAAHPRLAARLEPLRAQVREHVRVLGARLPATATGSSGTWSSGTGSPGTASRSASATEAAPGAASAPGPGTAAGGSSSAPSVPAVPADEGEALASLATAEQRLVDGRTEALLTLPGETARLFASVAAAGAAHVYLLTEGRK